jgi:hypothetical protein
LIPIAAVASDIYKCSGGRYVAYQNYPCPEGMNQIVMADTPRPAVVVQSTSAQRNAAQEKMAGAATVTGAAASDPSSAGVRPGTAPREDRVGDGPLPFRHTTLKLGISDDEVLNMPRWGVPDRISRSKVNGVWQEEWIYASRSDAPKRLHFQNARLAAIDTDLGVAPQQFASASLRQ